MAWATLARDDIHLFDIGRIGRVDVSHRSDQRMKVVILLIPLP